MDRLSHETLLSLLEVYEAGIRELRAMNDQGVAGLLLRFERRHAELVAAIATK